MRLESWKKLWSENGGNPTTSQRSGSVDTESEHDEPACDFHLQLNDASSPEV